MLGVFDIVGVLVMMLRLTNLCTLVEIDDIAKFVVWSFALEDKTNVASSKHRCEREEVSTGDA